MAYEIEVSDEQIADEEWAAREADVLADAGFALDPEALENILPESEFPAFESEGERREFEAWLDGLQGVA